MRHQQSERHPQRWFASIANKASQAAGRASAFVLACAVIVIWAVTGPLFRFSDTWQLVINTGTTNSDLSDGLADPEFTESG